MLPHTHSEVIQKLNGTNCRSSDGLAAAAELDPPHRPAAVLLSPPQQRDSWQKIPGQRTIFYFSRAL